ncbi:hypothetical protein CHISP_0078 [Chitinispirillum alkaliphilum]|nr:hypothetical protein CHISP_0078 [Chitinispirillum alkaliphilum]
MYCSQCGNKLSNPSKKCPDCGNKPDSPISSFDEQMSPRRRGKSRIMRSVVSEARFHLLPSPFRMFHIVRRGIVNLLNRN